MKNGRTHLLATVLVLVVHTALVNTLDHPIMPFRLCEAREAASSHVATIP